MGIKRASSVVRIVERAHGAVEDLKDFIQILRDANNVAGNIDGIQNLPQRIQNVIAAKTALDNLGLSQARLTTIMTDIMGYEDWVTDRAAFNQLFVDLPGLQTIIINNINSLTQTFNGNTLEWGPGAAQAAIETNLDTILAHYDF